MADPPRTTETVMSVSGVREKRKKKNNNNNNNNSNYNNNNNINNSNSRKNNIINDDDNNNNNPTSPPRVHIHILSITTSLSEHPHSPAAPHTKHHPPTP
jgi:hypothetical protein